MERYLDYCRSSLSKLNQFKSIHLVIGNESCDLDSAISSIVLAYVKYHELFKDNNSSSEQPSNTNNDSEFIVLPLLNVPREDLNLRREIVFWFEDVIQFNLKTLICRDEVDFDALNSSSAKITISLVDHNENKELARLLPKAQFDEIVDHHKPTYDKGGCQVLDPSKVHIDTTIGSCSTLVALRFLSCVQNSKFAENNLEVCFDSQIALVLYGPILLDTICFSHTAKRFNVRDYEAVNKLEDLLKHTPEAESSLFDRNEVYQRLVDAKNSLDGLTFTELLRKDMKIVESLSDNNLAICISSISGTLLTEMSLKEKLNELKLYCNNPPASALFSNSRQRLFNAIVLLSLDNRIPNNLRRQLSLHCTNKHLMRTIATCIERSELELELITSSETLRIYNQNNVTASRKVVLPIISTILNGPGSQQQRSNDDDCFDELPVSSSGGLILPSARRSATTTVSIDTGEVDPEYFLSYKYQTISVPEFEDFIRQNRTKSELQQVADNNINDCESIGNSPEGVKRSDSVSNNGGIDPILNPPSAPSSFIQQPDSYYGSYIEDSFVGDFVGEYDHEPVNGQENILVMDADGQNLVIKNPNDTSCMSHTHEIEFDFDSFGPESIIYAGNVDAQNNNNCKTNGTCEDEPNKSNGVEEKDCSTNDDSGFDKDNVDASNDSTPEKIISIEDEIKQVEEPVKSNKVEEDDSKSIDNGSESGTSSLSEALPSSDVSVVIQQNSSDTISINEVDDNPVTNSMLSPNSSTLLNNNNTGSFSRNSTLSRSQRKKILPQVNIKNLIISNDAFSPPLSVTIDPSLMPPLQSTAADATTNNNHSPSGQTAVNGIPKQTEQTENFIVSSLQSQQQQQTQNSSIILDPLNASLQSQNNFNECLNGSVGSQGLLRQPSIRKKVPVNYDMLLHNNYDQHEDTEKARDNSSELNKQQVLSDDRKADRNNGLNNVELSTDDGQQMTIPELSAKQEQYDERAWRQSCPLSNGDARPIDMKVIEPYRKVISHGGYIHSSLDGRNIEGSSPAIIIFSACFLPDRSRKDYNYVMDNLFMYVLTTLHNMIADDYILIYLHNGGTVQSTTSSSSSSTSTNANNMPTFGWLKRCYQMIDRKLKKNLKGLYLVHPTFWLKTFIFMSRPFISSKFSKKLKFVRSLQELNEMLPIEHIAIPEPVKIFDQLYTSSSNYF